MNRTDATRPEPPYIAAQVAAEWARIEAAGRASSLAGALGAQDMAFQDAMREMQRVRDFVGSPQHILGNPATKHGEIAEQVAVGVSRARDILLGRTPSASFDGVSRVGPVDYSMGGQDVQSKYYNNLSGSMKGVSEHSAKYPNFDGTYQIPRDQFQQAHPDAMAAAERQVGNPIQPGEATYDEVQQDEVQDTIRNREAELRRQNDDLKRQAQAEHGPTWAGAAKAAGIGAAVGGGVGLAQGVWDKYRQGKNPFKGDFTTRDWIDVGIPAGQGAAGGAVAGGSLYLLTNSTHLSAPFAGAVVSGLMGIGSLIREYQSGNIDGDEFVDMSQMVMLDAAIVGTYAFLGQALIPVPVLGAFVGSVAGKFVASAVSSALTEVEDEFIERLRAYERASLARLDAACQEYIRRLDAHFGNLERLADAAFDLNANAMLRLNASVRSAEALGVPDSRILRSTTDVDSFMTE